MPKLKTHSGAKKRFKLSKNGKDHPCPRLHVPPGQRPRQNPQDQAPRRGTTVLDKTNEAAIKRMLPYK